MGLSHVHYVESYIWLKLLVEICLNGKLDLMSKQTQKPTSTLKKSERTTLVVSAAVIIISFIFIGTPYVTFSWAFPLIVIADAILLVSGTRSESFKRIILLISILGALFAVLYVISVHFPWLLHY